MKHCIHGLFYTLKQTSRVCEVFCENYFKEHAKEGVSFDDFIILDTVECYPEICQRDLARLILKGTSHVSKLLDSLEKRGLILRPIDTKGNRMVKKTVMTEKGKEIYKYAVKIAMDFANQVENSINKKEAEECTLFLNKIKNSLVGANDIIFE